MPYLRPVRSLPSMSGQKVATDPSTARRLPVSARDNNEKDSLAWQQSNGLRYDDYDTLDTNGDARRIGTSHEGARRGLSPPPHTHVLGGSSSGPHPTPNLKKYSLARRFSGTTSKLRGKASKLFSRYTGAGGCRDATAPELDTPSPPRHVRDGTSASAPPVLQPKESIPSSPSERMAKQLEKCYSTSVSSRSRSPTSSPLTPPSLALHSVSSRTSSSPHDSEPSSHRGIDESLMVYPADPDIGFPFPVMPLNSSEVRKLPADVLESFGSAAMTGPSAMYTFPFLSSAPPLSLPARRISFREPVVLVRSPTVENLPIKYEPSSVFPPPPPARRSSTPTASAASYPSRPQLASAFSDWTTGDTASIDGRTLDSSSDMFSLRKTLARTGTLGLYDELQLSDTSLSPYSPLSPLSPLHATPMNRSHEPSPRAPAEAPSAITKPRGKLMNFETQTEDEVAPRSTTTSTTSLEGILPAQVVAPGDKIRVWRERTVMASAQVDST